MRCKWMQPEVGRPEPEPVSGWMGGLDTFLRYDVVIGACKGLRRTGYRVTVEQEITA